MSTWNSFFFFRRNYLLQLTHTFMHILLLTLSICANKIFKNNLEKHSHTHQINLLIKKRRRKKSLPLNKIADKSVALIWSNVVCVSVGIVDLLICWFEHRFCTIYFLFNKSMLNCHKIQSLYILKDSPFSSTQINPCDPFTAADVLLFFGNLFSWNFKNSQVNV